MSEIRWEPLEDGEYGNLYVNHSRNGESMEIGVLCDKNETDFISRYTWSGWLPPSIRLCRAVEPQALDAPDEVERIRAYWQKDWHEARSEAALIRYARRDIDILLNIIPSRVALDEGKWQVVVDDTVLACIEVMLSGDDVDELTKTTVRVWAERAWRAQP